MQGIKKEREACFNIRVEIDRKGSGRNSRVSTRISVLVGRREIRIVIPRQI